MARLSKAALTKAANPRTLGTYVGRVTKLHTSHSTHPNIRIAEHSGHHVELETIYRITVDGKRLKIPLMVDPDGQVHCHAVPNYQLSSALDMIKVVIDSFPEAFASPSKPGKGTGGHTGHGGLPKRLRAAAAPARKRRPQR